MERNNLLLWSLVSIAAIGLLIISLVRLAYRSGVEDVLEVVCANDDALSGTKSNETNNNPA